MSIALHTDFSQVGNISRAFHTLENFDKRELLDGLGFAVENQTKTRLDSEKSAPDGTPWPAWSPAYAKTREGGKSLLQDSNQLWESIQYLPYSDSVEIGSNKPYAAHHNFGGDDIGSGIPQREYLGFSAENEADLQSVVDDFLRQQLEHLQ